MAVDIMTCIKFTVNGEKCSVNECTPRETSLNAYLRYELHLPGTKAMCHEGGCGSCIVSVMARHPITAEMETFSVNSCLVLVFSCHGWEITTVEGVGNRLDGYHAIQKRMRLFHASQCGYCTPGWVMQMYSLLNKNYTMAELEKSFGSNTCRCTGFRPILDTMKSFAVDANPQLLAIADIEDLKICDTEKCERKCSIKSDDSEWTIVSKDMHLEDNKNNRPIGLNFEESRKFYKVYHIKEIFDILNRHGYNSFMLVAGNTGKGLYETFDYPKILIDISSVKKLKEHTIDQNLILGANMTLEDTRLLFIELSTANSNFKYLEEFAKHIEMIAHIPIRKIGTLAGNLMSKHRMPNYPSDLFVIFESVGAVVTMVSPNGSNTLTLLNFLQSDVTDKVMTQIILPPLSNTHIIRTYKVMPRHQNALAIVNASFVLKINRRSKAIEETSIVYGNISPTFAHANKTEAYLIGKTMNNNILQGAVNVLNNEIKPLHDPAKESAETRKKLAIGLFYKFILNTSPTGLPSPRLRSGGQLLQRPISKASRDFESDQGLYPLNQAVPRLDAIIQASGEALYTNDVPNMARQVFGAFVLSTVHVGEIDNIDGTEVLEMDGVIAMFTAKDIPGKNAWNHVGIQIQWESEVILADKEVKFYGQPVAIIVANSEALAARVAKKVKTTYKNNSSTPPILTIDEAKKDSKRVVNSDVKITPKGRGNDVTKVVKGVYEIESQYHYYTEPMTSVVIPADDTLVVYVSTQWLDIHQIAIADSLNMRESDVIVKLHRVGGSFGGKLSRSSQVACACALVAKKLNVPCRFTLPLQTNMHISGKRLPCQTEYEVGVDDNGKVQYLDLQFTEDDGYSHNESILPYCISGVKNGYNIDYWSVKAASVLTDLPSNSFARAPGILESIASIEHIMEHIAFAVKKDSSEVRVVNLRQEDNDLPQLIPMFKSETEYNKRLQEIKEFNKANRWIKKSIALNTMLYPVIYFGNYQAIVSIYRGDGTVTVTSGGMELGQGLNTKAAQVCAYTLDIPLEYVTVLPPQTFTSPNTCFTASSISTESVCFSVIKACEMLQKRLQPIKDGMTNPTWKELIFKAGTEMIDMTASFMMTDKDPELKPYSAYAVTVFEVELDVLLGRYEISRVDILEDVGLSANPALDIGQLEGGFVMGLGYFTSEKLRFDKKSGKLLTNRSLNYHVPLALDIPADLRVKLRYNSRNPKGVLNSKAVGEMGMCTSNGINHAIRKCIQESRNDSGYDPETWINIGIPNTNESILKALDVKLDEFVITS